MIVAAAAIFTRALGTRTNYDEGVYLASLEALRHGQRSGSDLYAIQPPAFYLLLRGLAAPFGHSIEAIRAAFALVGVLGVGAAVALGWRLYGAAAGLAAGALLAVAPPYPTVAPTVAADVPSIALGIVRARPRGVRHESARLARVGCRERRRARSGRARQVPRSCRSWSRSWPSCSRRAPGDGSSRRFSQEPPESVRSS